MGITELGRLFVIGLVTLLLHGFLHASGSKIASDYLNVCLDAKNHKKSPGPEDMLYKCDAWKNHSCCTNYTAESVEIDGTHLYNFNYSHCAEMSAKCLHRFESNLCFYECSPNVGPWIVQEKNSYRKERYRNVPLCKSECLAWWEDCRFDKTCVDNWSTGFEWSKILNKRTNRCPVDAKCRSFKEVFINATYFCEHIYGPYDYKVTDDAAAPCMKFTFSGGTNNSKVAEYYAQLATSPQGNSSYPTIPPYIPPSTPTLLQVPGTIASFVVAVLLLIAAAGIVVYFVVKRARTRFVHQGPPFQFSRVLATKFKRQATSHPVRTEDYDAEMSFMQYEEEEEEDPGMDGELRLEL